MTLIECLKNAVFKDQVCVVNINENCQKGYSYFQLGKNKF